MPVSESGAEVASVAGLGEGDPQEAPGDVDVELAWMERLDPAFSRSYFFPIFLVGFGLGFFRGRQFFGTRCNCRLLL